MSSWKYVLFRAYLVINCCNCICHCVVSSINYKNFVLHSSYKVFSIIKTPFTSENQNKMSFYLNLVHFSELLDKMSSRAEFTVDILSQYESLPGLVKYTAVEKAKWTKQLTYNRELVLSYFNEKCEILSKWIFNAKFFASNDSIWTLSASCVPLGCFGSCKYR